MGDKDFTGPAILLGLVMFGGPLLSVFKSFSDLLALPGQIGAAVGHELGDPLRNTVDPAAREVRRHMNDPPPKGDFQSLIDAVVKGI